VREMGHILLQTPPFFLRGVICSSRISLSCLRKWQACSPCARVRSQREQEWAGSTDLSRYVPVKFTLPLIKTSIVSKSANTQRRPLAQPVPRVCRRYKISPGYRLVGRASALASCCLWQYKEIAQIAFSADRPQKQERCNYKNGTGPKIGYLVLALRTAVSPPAILHSQTAISA
jgi:hypothetical protein